MIDEREARRRLFNRIMATTPDLVYLYDVVADHNIYANRAVGDILGYAPAEVQALGSAFLPTILHPDDLARRSETMGQVAALPDGAHYAHTYRARHADGGWRWLHDRTVVFEREDDGRPRVVLGIVQDITAQRTAEEALHERSADLATFIETMPIAVLVSHDAEGRQITGNAAAARLLRAPVGSNLSRTAPPEELATIHVVRRNGQALAHEDLPIQYVGRHGVPLHDPELEVVFEDGEVITIAGYVSPLLSAEGQVRGAIAAYVDLTEQRRVVKLERLFARLSDVLVHADDHDALLQRVTDLAVPELADYAVLDTVSADGTLARSALAHFDPAQRPLLEALRRYPPRREHPAGVPRALQTGEPLLIPEVADDQLAALAQDEGHYQALRALHPRSLLIVPLAARERVIGALTLTRTSPEQRYAERDLRTAREFAARVALAVENSWLAQETRRARQEAERAAARSARLYALTAALGEALTVAQVAEAVVAQAAQALGAAGGVLVLLDEAGGIQDLAGVTALSPALLARWRALAAAMPVPALDAAAAHEPIWLESFATMAAAYPHLASYWEEAGAQALAALPVVAQGRSLAVLALTFAAPRRDTSEERSFAQALALQCAQALERAQLYEAEHRARAIAEETQRRSAFLADMSRLLTDTLDYEVRLARLTRLVVPFLADYSLLYVFGTGGECRLVASAHVDAAKEPLLVEFGEQYGRGVAGSDSVVGRVLRSRSPILVPEADWATGRHVRMRAAYALLGPTSYMAVPLVVAGAAAGALLLAAAESGRRYGERDLAFAQEVAQRAAIALENARLYGEARAAVKLRDAFFSIAAHELKTPLTALLGQAHLLHRRLEREQSADERQRRSVETIVTQAARLDALITELLDVARIERGQFDLARAPFDLAGLVRGVVEETAPLSTRHSISCALPEGPLMVLGDAARLEQVVQNLLQNALKYSPAGGAIAVWARGDGEVVRVGVRDSGIGIPATALPRLFERFFRAENAESIGGMGVGLYVVKEIVTLHGGSVAVESHEGAGSTFLVTLPALRGDAEHTGRNNGGP